MQAVYLCVTPENLQSHPLMVRFITGLIMLVLIRYD